MLASAKPLYAGKSFEPSSYPGGNNVSRWNQDNPRVILSPSSVVGYLRDYKWLGLYTLRDSPTFTGYPS
jgi:hypothetical protein